MARRIDIDAYIHHSNTRQIMAALDYEVGRRRVVPLVGGQGTGKSRLLYEWANGGSKLFEPHEILCAEIWNPQRAKLKNATFTTAVAVITFSQLYGAITALTRRGLHDRATTHRHWDLQSEGRFPALFREVAYWRKELNIRVIVIDNAQWSDAYTVDRLMALRGDRIPRCGLVLCGQLQKDAATTEPFEDQFKADRAAAAACGESQILKRLTKAQFSEVEESVLGSIYELLAVEGISPEVLPKEGDIADDWWNRTQGDWRRIRRLIEGLDRALSKAKDRVVTPTVIEQTNVFLSGVEEGI